MKEQIRNYFNQLLPLSEEAWLAMAQSFQKYEFEKGEDIIRQGETCDFIAFLSEGSIRFYHLDDGNEKVTAFWFEGDFISNYRSFLLNKPSEHYIQSLSSGSYWLIRKEALERLYDQYPEIERLGRKMAERLYLMVTERLDKMLGESPEKRYQYLLQKNSRLILEIPQYMIASYLGISAESLSRIKKRLHRK